MTQEVQNTEAKNTKWVPKFKPVTVTRNGIEMEFKPTQVLRRENKGQEYLSAEVTPESLDTMIGWASPAIIANKVGAFIRMMSQGWWKAGLEEATDEKTGQVNEAKLMEVFIKLATDFSARGESIPDLKAQIDDLVAQISELDPTDDNFATMAKELAGQIKDKNLAISLKRRKTDDEKEAVMA